MKQKNRSTTSLSDCIRKLGAKVGEFPEPKKEFANQIWRRMIMKKLSDGSQA